jgi:diphthamide biosynthesis protein 7
MNRMNSKSIQQPQSIDTLILDLPPSCIEFWDLHPEYFVIGTYNLEKPAEEYREPTEYPSEKTQPSRPQERNGSLILCRLIDNQIQIIHTFLTEYAILDLHFACEINLNGEKNNTNCFYTANSTGSIAMYEIAFSGEGLSKPFIQRRSLNQLWPKDTLVLSLCLHPSDPMLMSLTLSTGEVYIRKEGSGSTGIRKWLRTTSTASKMACHSLEAWTSTFMEGGRAKELLLSGGDDGILQYISTPADLSPDHLPDEGSSHNWIALLQFGS